MRKHFFMLMLISMAATTFAQKGMPMDKNSGRPSYEGRINISGADKNRISDEVGIAIATYTDLRGSMGPMFVNSSKDGIYGQFSVLANEKMRSEFTYVNASYTINIIEGGVKYEITDLRVFTLSQASFYSQMGEDKTGLIPIEKHGSFNILDFERKNDNAKITDGQIQEFIAHIKKHLEKKF